METVKVSSKGQVVIPKSVRDSHHIRSGDKFVVTAVGNELHFKPVLLRKQSTLKAVAGVLHRAGAKKLSEAQIKTRIAAALREQDEICKK